MGVFFGDGLDSTFLLGFELVVKEEESLLVVSRKGTKETQNRKKGEVQKKGRTHSGRPEMTNILSPVSS